MPFLAILILNLIKCKFLLSMALISSCLSVGLATIGVCVFSAVASVAALFIFEKRG